MNLEYLLINNVTPFTISLTPCIHHHLKDFLKECFQQYIHKKNLNIHSNLLFQYHPLCPKMSQHFIMYERTISLKFKLR